MDLDALLILLSLTVVDVIEGANDMMLVLSTLLLLGLTLERLMLMKGGIHLLSYLL